MLQSIDSVGSEDVWIVDHSEKAQTLPDLTPDRIVGIIDHHKLGDLQTSKPPVVVIMPLGSTATVIAQIARNAGVEFPDPLKGVMLSCILSDTVILKSPTTTEVDREVARSLAEEMAGQSIAIAQVEVSDPSVIDVETYRQAMDSLCRSEGYDAYVFAVTDIIEEGSHIVVSGMETRIGEALDLDLSSGSAWAPGVMSRKKQIVPPLQESLG